MDGFHLLSLYITVSAVLEDQVYLLLPYKGLDNDRNDVGSSIARILL